MSQREFGIVCPIDEHICGSRQCTESPHMPLCMTRVTFEFLRAKNNVTSTGEFKRVYGENSLINKGLLQICKELGVDPELMREALGFSILHRTRP